MKRVSKKIPDYQTEGNKDAESIYNLYDNKKNSAFYNKQIKIIQLWGEKTRLLMGERIRT
jgi:hypothetical protein